MEVEDSKVEGDQPTEDSTSATDDGKETCNATHSDAQPGVDVSNDVNDGKEAPLKTDRPETSQFDQSHRKLMVINIFKFDDSKKLRKTCDKWTEELKEKGTEIVVERIRKAPKENWAVLTMSNADMVKALMDYINNTESIVNKRGLKLTANFASDNAKRPGGDGLDRSDVKRQRVEEAKQTSRRPVTEEEIKDRITPLWKVSYENQVSQKTKEMVKKCAMKIVSETKSRFRTIARSDKRRSSKPYVWLEGKRCIDVQKLISAPHPIRNKTELTFGYRYLFQKKEPSVENSDLVEHEKVPAVGFMVTGWSGGVCKPHCCDNIPREACSLVDVMDEFLKTSPLPPYDTKTHQGFWRILTIRNSRRTRECMIIVVHTSPETGGAGDTEGFSKHFESEKERLTSVLTNAELVTGEAEVEPYKVTSLFFQDFVGLSHPSPEHPVQHIFGKQFLLEKLGKCTFQISPGAFFQVNTEGAELLYQLVVDKVKEVSPLPEDTVLYDVCCGTGTIGLTCMKEGAAGIVVGIDISEPAIADAKKNAELNGYETGSGKTQFVASRAEQAIGRVMRENRDSGKKFVAVVDPAREGLHADVIRALRGNGRIQRLIYVSCNPTGSLVRDAALLCSPQTKKYTGNAFRVSSACPVDMFRLTSHCEIVMTFDRLSDDEV